MVKEDKKENNKGNMENEKLDYDILGLILPTLTGILSSLSLSSPNYDFDIKQLKDLYHTLDKRLAILESKNTKKKFLSL